MLHQKLNISLNNRPATLFYFLVSRNLRILKMKWFHWIVYLEWFKYCRARHSQFSSKMEDPLLRKSKSDHAFPATPTIKESKFFPSLLKWTRFTRTRSKDPFLFKPATRAFNIGYCARFYKTLSADSQSSLLCSFSFPLKWSSLPCFLLISDNISPTSIARGLAPSK